MKRITKLFVFSGAMILLVLVALVGVAASAEPTVTMTAANIVHRGEGLEHPMIRQLIADPDILANPGVLAKIGIKPFSGNPATDTADLKKWAGTETQILAQADGLFGSKFHEEIRVKAPDAVAVAIEKDASTGTIKIVITTADDAHAQIVDPSVATSPAEIHFVGPQDGSTILPAPYSQFAYMYVPD